MNGFNRNERGRSQAETGKKIKNYLYHYSDMIGRGNFAKVFKGTNMQTDQIVAIKMISLDELKSRHLEELVFEEIRILQLLKHPNVLGFVEALLSERNCYIVTELCRDGSLQDRIKTGVPFSEQELGRIVLDLWEGLRYMRQKKVAHRDLKPANIFMSRGRAIIADFGLAKFYTERFKDLDIGSPHYMSPEGILLNCYSQKTDIWAFGITIFEMLHGNSPFQFCKRQNDLRNYVNRPIPDSWWRRDINPLLKQFVIKCLQIDQYKRPSIFQLANEPYLRNLLNRGSDLAQDNRTNNIFLQRQVQQVPQELVKSRTHDRPQVPSKGFRPLSLRQLSGDRDSPDVKDRGDAYREIPPSKKFDFRQEMLRIPLNSDGVPQQKLTINASFTKKYREEPRSYNPSPTLFRNSPPQLHAQQPWQSGNNFSLAPKVVFTDRRDQIRCQQADYIYQNSPMRRHPSSVDPRRQICQKTSETNESEDERRHNNRLSFDGSWHF